MADVLNFPATDDLEMEIEPDLEMEPDDVGIEIEPDQPLPPVPAASVAGLVSSALVEILPADFPLPLLARFIPNAALRKASDDAAAYALSIAVEGTEGLQRADVALTTLRASLKAIDEHFKEPREIANDLHKRLTGIIGDWQSSAKGAMNLLGAKVYAEQKRLDQLAAEERRRVQAEADRLAREAAQREVDAAAKAQAPAPVVEELKRQAATATAPPVAAPLSAPAPMRSTTTVTTWKGRIAGTSGDAEANPEMATLTPAQRLKVFELLRGILEGRDPLVAIEINWPYVNNRSKADKGTFAISGLEAFEVGSVRAKSGRR